MSNVDQECSVDLKPLDGHRECPLFGNGDSFKRGIEWKRDIDNRLKEFERMNSEAMQKLDKINERHESMDRKLSWIYGVGIGIGFVLAIMVAMTRIVTHG